MFLTAEELAEATGCTQPAAQEKWFQDHGLNVYRNRLNQVKVARDAFVRWQLGEKAVAVKREPVLRMA